MQNKPGWPVTTERQLELPLNLPPKPGIKSSRPILSDICPRCRCMHTDAAAVQACRSLAAQREQL